MGDVSKTNELITEARTAAPGDDPTELAVMVHRLADALEAQTGVRVDMSSAVGVETQLAATRLPEQGEASERVKKIILESLVFTNENSDPWARLLTESILAALDGAPEPEWEHALFVADDDGVERITSWAPGEFDEARQRWPGLVFEEKRRIKAPWLSVDGEQS